MVEVEVLLPACPWKFLIGSRGDEVRKPTEEAANLGAVRSELASRDMMMEKENKWMSYLEKI